MIRLKRPYFFFVAAFLLLLPPLHPTSVRYALTSKKYYLLSFSCCLLLISIVKTCQVVCHHFLMGEKQEIYAFQCAYLRLNELHFSPNQFNCLSSFQLVSAVVKDGGDVLHFCGPHFMSAWFLLSILSVELIDPVKLMVTESKESSAR